MRRQPGERPDLLAWVSGIDGYDWSRYDSGGDCYLAIFYGSNRDTSIEVLMVPEIGRGIMKMKIEGNKLWEMPEALKEAVDALWDSWNGDNWGGWTFSPSFRLTKNGKEG